MKYLVAAVFFLAGAFAVTNPQHWAFANKCVNLGVKIINNKTIYNMSTCMDPFLYNTTNLTTLQNLLQTCVLKYAGSAMGVGMTIYTNLTNCLKPTGDDVISLAMALMSSNSDVITPYMTAAAANLKKWKAAGQAKAAVLENLYKWGVTQLNKTVINKQCTAFVKSGQLSPAQWKCLVTAGKSAIDISSYACATQVPPAKGK